MTLIETTVVLAIIATIAGTAALSLGGSDRQGVAEAEAVKLAARLQLGVDIALVDGSSVAVQWDSSSYRFQVAEPKASGATMSGESTRPPLSGSYDLPSGVRLSGPSVQTLVLDPEGAGSPAVFVLSNSGQAWEVEFDGLNSTIERGLAP